jgi:hypothetical protein
MSFNKTYFLYLGLVVGLPTLLIALILKSVGWTLGVLIFTNILARLCISLFHLLFRSIGDMSDVSKFNTSLRMVMTDKNYETALKRIFPDDNTKLLTRAAQRATQMLVQLGEKIDKKEFSETEARERMEQQFPLVDKGNLDWLNSRGRIFLRRKGRALIRHFNEESADS